MSDVHEPARWLDATEGEAPDRWLLDGLRAGREELPGRERLAAIWAGLGPLAPDGGPEGGPDGGTEGGADPGGDLGGVSDLGGIGAAAGGLATVKASGLKIAAVAVLATAAVGTPTYYAMRDTGAPPLVPTATVTTATAVITPPPPLPIIDTAPVASVAPPAVASAPALVVPRPTEIELLQRAQSALGSQPARALALVDEATSLYPQGGLGQEREMIRIQALAGVGRRPEALAAARAFRDRYPSSPHVRRLEQLFPELTQP